jgi:hypothetical protein
VSKRKTITIQETEFNNWIELKAPSESWTSLMRRVRSSFGILNQRGPILDIDIRRVRRMPSSKTNTNRGQRPSIKSEFVKEMNSIFDGSKTFRDILKPISDDDLNNIQLSEEELKKRDQKRRFEQLKPPK